MALAPTRLAGLCAAVCLTASGTSLAQTFPTQPVTLVVPFAPGGGADIVARLVAQQAATQIGQTIIINNRAGAGGSIGASAVADATADGHNLLFVTAGQAGMKALYPRLSFDPLESFTPIVGLAELPIVIAVPANSPYQSLNDLVADAHANPGKLNCAGGGGGATVTNLAFEDLKATLGLEITAVPYRGSAPAATALMGGEIDCDSDTLAALLPFLQSGQLRALAVMNTERVALLPEVPTVTESVLPGFSANVWYGLLAPRDTPAPVVTTLREAFGYALQQPVVTQRFQELAATPLNSDPAEFGAFMQAETTRWSDVIRQLGLEAQ